MLSIWRAESFLPSMTSSGSDSSYLGRDYSSQFTHTLTPLCTLKKKKNGGREDDGIRLEEGAAGDQCFGGSA